MIEETQENIVQSETPVAEVAGVSSTQESAGSSKWSGISTAVDAESTKPTKELSEEVSADTPDEVGTDLAPVSKWAGVGNSDSKFVDPNIVRDKEVNIDLDDYRDYLGNDIYLPQGSDAIGALDKSRAINQSFWEQGRNFLGQAVVGEIVGGTIEGLGYVLDIAGWADIAKGEEKEWGNWLSDIGKDLREGTQEYMPIYQVNEGEFDMADSGWWFSNAVSVASTLSMMIPAAGTVKALSFLGKGMSKALAAISKMDDIALGMGKQAKWMANGVSQAVVSRHIENHMEASGTFESTKTEFLNSIDPKTGVKFTEEDATKYASDAAASNYRLGWAMIMQDIPQYLAIGKVFNPRTMKMESAMKKATQAGKKTKMKPWQSKGLSKGKAAAATFFSEGAEESYQYYIAERGTLKAKLDAGLIDQEEYDEELSDKIGDTEMMTSAFWGGFGGNIFQAVGPRTQSLFKSKATRESEANWAKIQTNFLKNRGKSYEAMQKELAVADQMGDPTRREQIINEMMIGMSLEALSVDKFEQHMESLASLAEMSKEEQEAYKKEQGIELDIDLFKQYVPAALKVAEQTKKRYMKHLNKHDSSVASLMANNDIHIQQFQERIDALNQETTNASADFVGSSKMSSYAKEIPQKKALIAAYKRANEIHRANLSDKASPRKKKSVEDTVKRNEEFIQSLENSLASDYKTKEDIHPENTMYNKKYKAGYQTMLEENQDKQVEKILLEDGIGFRHADNAHVGSKKYQTERKKAMQEFKIATLEKEEDISIVRKNIKENEDFSKEEKAELIEKLDAREKQLVAKRKAAEKKEQQELHDKKKAEEAAATQEENPGDLVDNNVAPIEDNVEDEFSEEESDHVENVLDKSEAAVEVAAESNRDVKLLDTVASEGYNEWVTNGKEKTDKVEFVVSDYNGKSPNILKAIDLFNKGIINDFVYEYLPIKVMVGSNPDVFTFLPTLTANISRNEGAFDTWNKRDLPQRKIIIDMLKDGKPAISEIALTTGGDLVMDKNEDGSPAQNLLTDLQQVEDLDDIQLAITNKDGDLVDSDTRKGIEGFKGKKYMVTGVTDEKGNEIPYKGGVFLMVNKADGKQFPLRLNLSKHTPKQAEGLTEVLAAVATGKVKLEQAMTDLPADVRAFLEENLSEELALTEDGSVKDFINLLGYTSKSTQGKKSQLMFSKDFKSVIFGEGKGKVLNSKNLEEGKKELIKFLQETKKVNFNSKLWATSPEYREWVVGSGVISTNATTKGPMFKRTNKRQTKVFVKAIQGPAPAPKVEVKAEASNSDQAVRMDKTERAGIEKGEAGIPGYTGYYYNQVGGVVAVNDSTKEAVKKKIDAKYKAENKTVRPTSSKTAPQTDADKQARLDKSMNSIEKSTMGLPGYEGIYFTPDGKTLSTNGSKADVTKWIEKKFAAEPKLNPMPVQKEELPTTDTKQQTSEVEIKEVADGVKIIDNALSQSEEKEIFEMIKPFLESQGSRSNKGKAAPIMIGMGLRWDYKSNNPGKSPVEIKETIVNSQGQRNKYAYYDVSIDGEALGAIPTRLKELMTKATGVDASNYDGVIINIYPEGGFISAHNDVDESVTAINYPVIVANIGGAGSLSIEGSESQKARKGYSSKEYVNEPLSSGSAYIFGEDGKNRNVFHRTLPSSGKGNLPQLNVRGQIIPANSYRISVTLRRVKDLEPGMPTTPNKITKPTQQTSEVEVTSPKNVFTVEPIQAADKKAKSKAKIATQYIGFAEGIAGSSTASYAKQAGKFANTGSYASDDVIFVSIGGRRGSAALQKSQQDRTIREAIKAIEAGATIITDNKAYTDSSSYNTGEKRLYKNLENKGYVYSEVKVDGQTLGTWSKSSKPSQTSGAKSTATISQLEKTGFTYPFGKTDKSAAYYEGHPDYKITIDGKKVTTWPWAESTSDGNTTDNSQRVTSGRDVQPWSESTTYIFKTAAEARAKAKQLAETQQNNGRPTAKKPLQGVSNQAIEEMSESNFIELEETGHTQWMDKEGNTSEAVYSKAVSPGKVIVPDYKVNKKLSNDDGSKRFAQTDGKNIQINPVQSVEEFFDYLTGKEGGQTSLQKQAVLEQLELEGYSLETIRGILKNKKDINTFLVLHEQDHIDNKDKDVYWKNGKDMMTPDKIKIETRATIAALKKIQGGKKAEVLSNESKPSPAQQRTIDSISNIQSESTEFAIEEVTIDGVVHSVYKGQGKTLERQSNMVTRLDGKEQESNDNMKKGAAVGNFVDILARDIFGTTGPKSLSEYLAEAKEMNKGNNGYLLKVTEQEFNTLVRQIQGIKQDLAQAGHVFVSEEVFLHREYNEKEKEASGFDGMGGTLDLVSIDRNGKIHIIDFKNIKFSEKNSAYLASNIYGPSNFPTKTEKWSAQQTVYADAAYNKHGLDVGSINILPVSATYEEKDGTISMDKFQLTNTLIGTTTMGFTSLSKNLINLEFDIPLRDKLNKMFVETAPAPENLADLLDATDESRDKSEAAVQESIQSANSTPRSLRAQRRAQRNNKKSLEAKVKSAILQDNKLLTDPNPGKDKGPINKKCK